VGEVEEEEREGGEKVRWDSSKSKPPISESGKVN
jgi:hypothetical protein